MQAVKLPKMGFYFMLSLIAAQLIYLGFESYYNGFVIDVRTSTPGRQRAFELTGKNFREPGPIPGGNPPFLP